MYRTRCIARCPLCLEDVPVRKNGNFFMHFVAFRPKRIPCQKIRPDEGTVRVFTAEDARKRIFRSKRHKAQSARVRRESSDNPEARSI